MIDEAPPGMNVVRRVVALLGVVALLVGVAACSLPTDERAEPYNLDALPAALTETTTTTTTTTTTSTTVPLPSVPDESTTTSTTSTTPIRREPVNVFYTIGSTDQIQPLVLDRASPVALSTIKLLLESPDTDIAGLGLRTSVRPGMIDSVRFERGVATIDLDPSVLDRMAPSQQRRAVSQIVLTYTSFVVPGQGAIGLVRLESDGEPYEVFVPALGASSEPGDLLTFSDFSELISAFSAPSTTTTTVASTVTSGPPNAAVADTTTPDPVG